MTFPFIENAANLTHVRICFICVERRDLNLYYTNSKDLPTKSIGHPSAIGRDKSGPYGKYGCLAIKLDSGKDVSLLRRGALSLPLRLAWRIRRAGRYGSIA